MASYLEGKCQDPRYQSTSEDAEANLITVFCSLLRDQNSFSKPLPWIGMYITLASLFCILAMLADLLHGLRNRKLWFPCKYFTLNAASLTVIAVTIKLPMDLNNPMRGEADQTAKVGSLAFMCSMMANILPSIATMDVNELIANIIGLSVLVITLVVNVCIQIETGVVSKDVPFGLNYRYKSIATIYVGILFMLLTIYISSSLAILRCKQMLESKYQELHETSLKDQPSGRLSVQQLKRYVRNYWIMAGTGGPQFMTTSLATTSASGVICAFNTIFHILILCTSLSLFKEDYDSDYKWSIRFIFIMQFVGGALGTIAPLSRCFASLSFKLSTKLIWKHSKAFNVESYWTQKLYEWKQSSVPSPFHSRKCKILIENLKIITLSFCIGFQKSVVVACKMIALIPIFFVVCVWCCSHCWKWLRTMFRAMGIVFGQNPSQVEENEDLRQYALQIQEDIELSARTLKAILKSVNRLIQKAEKKQPNNLMKLLAESRGFEGVRKYDNHHVPPLISEGYLNCWSLPLVTLTTIAISIPNIGKNRVDWLLSSVSEGLVYVRLVEDILNATDEYVNTRKAAKNLWLEVEVYQKWLGIRLRKHAPQLNTTGLILQWFKNAAINIINDVESRDIRFKNDNSICRSVSANSMYRITETIFLSYHDNIVRVSQEELFVELSSMNADILAACLINLPRVIMMKCHTSEIEKRDASIHVAAKRLGETMQIIDCLKDRDLPDLDADELPFIDKWCAFLNHPNAS